MSTFEYGDVRVLCHDPEELNGRLHIGGLMFASQLHDYPEQRARYRKGAIVPDPGTIRPCTPEETTYYVHPLATA